jgi:hypothetical protein
MTRDAARQPGTAAAAPRSTEAARTPGKHTLTEGLHSGFDGGLLQRDADGNGVAPGADAAVAAAGSSSGIPLPGDMRGRFESSLGTDLSSVRVHTGGASQTAAAAVGARAYTLGQDIHFGAGHYDPGSAGGQHLLAHEVAHTVQQAGGVQGRQHKLEISAPGDAHEVEADRAADAMVRGESAPIGNALAGVSRKIMCSPDGGAGSVALKTSAPIMVKELKIPARPIGYFEVSGEVKFSVSVTGERTKPEAKPEAKVDARPEAGGEKKEEKAESEVTIKPDAIEAEVKKKYADLGGGVSIEGSIGDSINWKERKFEIGAGLKLVAEGETITSDVGVKFIPFTIDDTGIHIGEIAIEGSGGLKKNASIDIGGATFSCKPSVSWKAGLALNKERITAELLKKLAQRVGMTAAGEALLPASMIAAGALTVFMYFDTILAADDLRQLVDAGPPAVARARQFILQATQELQGGDGPALQQMAQKLSKDFGGAIPPAMLARALKENVAPDQLKALMWPPMRQQIIDRSVADYRSKHKVESAFKDMTTWVGEKIGAKDDRRSTYGEDILYRTLNEILPRAL